MIRPFKRYFEVSGRANRAEYWQFILFQALVSLGVFGFWVTIVLVSPPRSMMIPSIGLGIGYLIFLGASIIPNVTVIIRRLHDTNRSAWWLCLYIPGLVATGQTLMLVVRGLNATPAEMSQMVSQTINGTVLGMSSLICQLTMFVYMILPGTKGANRFGDTLQALEVVAEKPVPATPEIDFEAVEAELTARRLSLSNLPLQPVRPSHRPAPKLVAAPVLKSLEAGPYNPGIKPAQPFGRRGAR
jgi:uncharacterized membrane protein YhaH (DUF805 family)